eukprot:CAMPEP_0175114614 /NCGR_PEP_ID=MMETSP0086_2-20121207/16985_1 /TAXON_ID=136419 /ORGANISM="Unknown Unknown, Strain D1" /LENGTH=30 /DNA_ID= /DNA_START= /DNA_END= /DNA_ORIENTATION=
MASKVVVAGGKTPGPFCQDALSHATHHVVT